MTLVFHNNPVCYENQIIMMILIIEIKYIQSILLMPPMYWQPLILCALTSLCLHFVSVVYLFCILPSVACVQSIALTQDFSKSYCMLVKNKTKQTDP